MARPVKKRRICAMPHNLEFCPQTRQAVDLVEITIDEYETLRLIDYLDCTQEECAIQMNVARTTVQAIYDSARKKMADALVNGKRIKICGGNYTVCPNSLTCCGKDCKDRICRRTCCENGSVEECKMNSHTPEA